MSSKRAYREALDLVTIKKELKRNKGSQFDAEVVDVFLDILEEQKHLVWANQSSNVLSFPTNRLDYC